MSDYSIIADASNCLLKLLREHVCPDPILSPESIMLVTPSDKTADFQLGLCLYEIRELSEMKNSKPYVSVDNVRMRHPKPLSLNYLVFINSRAQIAASAEMEQRIFGRVIQALSDVGEIQLTDINPHLPPGDDQATITLTNNSFEEKVRIWTSLQTPYQLGVYFTLAPAMLPSRIMEDIYRTVRTTLDTKIIPPGAKAGMVSSLTIERAE